MQLRFSRAQNFLHFRDVRGHINAYGVVFRFDHADLESVFQPAKLFELFDALEFPRRQRRIFEQRVAAVTVKADVLQCAARRLSLRYRAPRGSGAREK